MIQLKCPSCSKPYKVKDAASGKKFECKKCGETVTVPKARSSRGSSSSSSSSVKRRTGTAAPARKKPKPEPDDLVEDAFVDDGYEDYEDYGDDYGDGGGYDEYDDYEPAPKRSSTRKSSSKSKSKGKSKSGSGKKKKSSGGGAGLAFGFNLNRINAAITVVGGMLIFFGIQESRLSAMAEAEPTEISLQELLENGAPDNIHLTITGINCILDETVLYGDEVGGRITKVDRAWIPATPPGGGQVKFIIKCTKASTENELPPSPTNAKRLTAT